MWPPPEYRRFRGTTRELVNAFSKRAEMWCCRGHVRHWKCLSSVGPARACRRYSCDGKLSRKHHAMKTKLGVQATITPSGELCARVIVRPPNVGCNSVSRPTI